MEVATVQVKPESALSRPLLKTNEERFCQLYSLGGEDFRQNATWSYAEAFGKKLETLSREKPVDKEGKIIGKSQYERAYAVCASAGKDLLKKPHIRERMVDILNDFLSDKNVDAELAKVITQDGKLEPKVSAIREFNKLRRRVEPDGGEASKSVTFNIVNFGNINLSKGNNDSLPVRTEVVPASDIAIASPVQGGGDPSQGRQEQDGTQSADSKVDGGEGAVPVPTANAGTS